MPVDIKVVENKDEMAKQVAAEIIDLINTKKQQCQNCVLCLPTGSTPIPVYQEIVRRSKEESIDFGHVYTFNLDEYSGLPHDHPESYHYFMNQNLFNHISIPKDHIHIPEGFDDDEQARKFAQDYESKIKQLGGLDLAMLGIGRTGHIGFNEPGAEKNSRTRRVVLHEVTRQDAKPAFQQHGEEVPTHAVTMGIGSILDSERIIMMATGANKKEIVERFRTEEPSTQNPSTFLKEHSNCTVFVDQAAA
ncbi:hypothetical protein P9112_000013 [Eukaryota sp. TZLM1-RC]